MAPASYWGVLVFGPKEAEGRHRPECGVAQPRWRGSCVQADFAFRYQDIRIPPMGLPSNQTKWELPHRAGNTAEEPRPLAQPSNQDSQAVASLPVNQDVLHPKNSRKLARQLQLCARGLLSVGGTNYAAAAFAIFASAAASASSAGAAQLYLLLAAGFAGKATDGWRYNLAHHAAASGSMEALLWLRAVAPRLAVACSDDGLLPVQVAAIWDQPVTLGLLLPSVAYAATLTTPDGLTLAQLASRRGSQRAFELLQAVAP